MQFINTVSENAKTGLCSVGGRLPVANSIKSAALSLDAGSVKSVSNDFVGINKWVSLIILPAALLVSNKMGICIPSLENAFNVNHDSSLLRDMSVGQIGFNIVEDVQKI